MKENSSDALKIDPEDVEIAAPETKAVFLELIKELLEQRGHSLTALNPPALITEEFVLSEEPQQTITLHYWPFLDRSTDSKPEEIFADALLSETGPDGERMTFFTYRKDGSVDRFLDNSTAEEMMNLSEKEIQRRVREAKRDRELGIPRVSNKKLKAFNELLKMLASK